MEERSEKILKIANEMKSGNNYDTYETLLDEMCLSLVQGDLNSDTKGDAYWLTMNLKKLLKEVCSETRKK